MEPSRLRWPEPPPPSAPSRPEPRPHPRPEQREEAEWEERSLPARRPEPADQPSPWPEAAPARRPVDPGHRPADPGRQERPASGRPGTIILNPSGSGTNGTGTDDLPGDAGGDDPHLTGERPGFPLPAQPPANGIDLRVDPFAALDREMARAIARKLAEALERYATPALVPLVVDQMAEILEVDKPRVTRTGKDSTPP